ncbi:MAG: phytanoyl-CoA dioxygenase, partial [Chitinophagaceae bacterium]
MRKFTIPDFVLGETITEEQLAFFQKHGVLMYRNFLPQELVYTVRAEVSRVEQQLLADGVDKIHGIPLKFGKDELGNRTIQRICFTSKFSPMLQEMLRDPRLQALTALVQPFEGRIGEYEKDGLVLNNYVRTPNSAFSQMGWHTDSPRDLFLGQRIMPMLNVGIHLDNCPI